MIYYLSSNTPPFFHFFFSNACECDFLSFFDLIEDKEIFPRRAVLLFFFSYTCTTLFRVYTFWSSLYMYIVSVLARYMFVAFILFHLCHFFYDISLSITRETHTPTFLFFSRCMISPWMKDKTQYNKNKNKNKITRSREISKRLYIIIS